MNTSYELKLLKTVNGEQFDMAHLQMEEALTVIWWTSELQTTMAIPIVTRILIELISQGIPEAMN